MEETKDTEVSLSFILHCLVCYGVTMHYGLVHADGNSLESQYMQQKYFPYNSINI